MRGKHIYAGDREYIEEKAVLNGDCDLQKTKTSNYWLIVLHETISKKQNILWKMGDPPQNCFSTDKKYSQFALYFPYNSSFGSVESIRVL